MVSRAEQAGSMLTWFMFFLTTMVFVLIFLRLLFLAATVFGSVFEPITAAGGCDDLGLMKEPVLDHHGRGNFTKHLSPVLQ